MNSETKSEPAEKPKLILIPGPTGVGKTGLLDEIFSGKGEVISADSMQVYRYLDIGTAKPSRELLHRLPHHLISILDPREQFHAGEFLSRSNQIIGDILARKKIPLLSGGTAFYFQIFLFGLPASPPSNLGLRQTLKSRLDAEGPEALFKELADVDPASAERIAPGDHYRILRALEVYHSCGKPLSAFPRPQTIRNDFDLLFLGLSRDREELNRRIDLRVDAMFEEGLYEEFRGLLRRGYREDDPGMKSIGYREFFDLELNGCHTLGGVKAGIKQNSRHYAKRQMTFFKSLFPFSPGNPGQRETPGFFSWFHPERDRDVIENRVTAFLS